MNVGVRTPAIQDVKLYIDRPGLRKVRQKVETFQDSTGCPLRRGLAISFGTVGTRSQHNSGTGLDIAGIDTNLLRPQKCPFTFFTHPCSHPLAASAHIPITLT